MKKLTATLTMTFTNGNDELDLQTNDVPMIMVLEALNNLTKALAKEILNEECDGIPPEGQETFFDKLIEIERKNLRKKLS